MTPPFRADHVGSLLRPPELLEARARHAAGQLRAEALAEVEDRCIAEVVRMQQDAGLQSATDGEFRRASWHMDFIYQLGGISQSDERIEVHFKSSEGELSFTPAALHVRAPITLEKTIFGPAFSYLKSCAGTSTPKLTIPSPSMVHYRGGRAAIDESVYPDMEQFWDDLASAYREEVKRLAELGCTYLQLDDTSLAYLNDPEQRELVRKMGGDPEHQHERYVRQLNAVLADRPEGLFVTTHSCRGNFQSSWVAEGGYDFVAETMFGQLDVDGFFLEFDDERSGGFEPLRYVPAGKKVVLGLVTTKSPVLESKDTLKRRIEQASRYVPLEQLCLSPQCGFSSTVEGNRITIEDEKAKLRLVVETAAEVWG
ncbi:MAG: 5-methyltetrahydropteroyltriglutamate--homocysteine S-methyltransferase [Acidimicrobiales bacterium]